MGLTPVYKSIEIKILKVFIYKGHHDKSLAKITKAVCFGYNVYTLQLFDCNFICFSDGYPFSDSNY